MDDNVVIGFFLVLSFIVGLGLGYLVRLPKKGYPLYAGEIEIKDGDPGKKVYSLNLNCEPEDLLFQDRVMFHIVEGRV